MPDNNNNERRHPLLSLDISTITTMLSPLFPFQELLSAEPLSGGLINTNYKITLSGLNDPVVLRIYTVNPSACANEAAILSLVRGTVPVPEILYTESNGIHYDRPYSVMTWVDGIALMDAFISCEADEIRQIARSAGAILAAIGSYTFPHPGFFGPNLTIAEPMKPVMNYIEMYLQGRAGERLGTEMTERVLRLVHENEALLTAAKNARSLVHSDFQPSNIRVKHSENGWQIAAILDWEFVHAGRHFLILPFICAMIQSFHQDTKRTLFRAIKSMEGNYRGNGRKR